jgi:hypothetical protein
VKDFSFGDPAGLLRDTTAHWPPAGPFTEASNIVLLRRPETAKHTRYRAGNTLTQLGHRVPFATAIDLFARLQNANQDGRPIPGTGQAGAATASSTSMKQATSRSSQSKLTALDETRKNRGNNSVNVA